MSHSNCTFQRTVFFGKRLNAVLTKAEMSRLSNATHVAEIAYTKNNTASEIRDIIIRAFPSLAGKDLSG